MQALPPSSITSRLGGDDSCQVRARFSQHLAVLPLSERSPAGLPVCRGDQPQEAETPYDGQAEQWHRGHPRC